MTDLLPINSFFSSTTLVIYLRDDLFSSLINLSIYNKPILKETEHCKNEKNKIDFFSPRSKKLNDPILLSDNECHTITV